MHSPPLFLFFCFCLQFPNIIALGRLRIPEVAMKTAIRNVARPNTFSPSPRHFSVQGKLHGSNSQILKPQNVNVLQPASSGLALPQHFKSAFSNFSTQNTRKFSSMKIPKEFHSPLSNSISINLKKASPIQGKKSDNELLKHFLEIVKSVLDTTMKDEFKSLNGIFEGEKENEAPRFLSTRSLVPSRILYTLSDLAADTVATDNRIIEMGSGGFDDEKMEKIRKKARKVYEKEMEKLEKMFRSEGEQGDNILPKFLPKKLAENAGIKIIDGNKMKWETMEKIKKYIQQKLGQILKEVENEGKWKDKKEIRKKIRNTEKQIEMLRMRLEMAEMAKMVAETEDFKEMEKNEEMIKNYYSANSIINEKA